MKRGKMIERPRSRQRVVVVGSYYRPDPAPYDRQDYDKPIDEEA